MRKIYLDTDFKCHVTGDGAMPAVETDVFDGKCDGYVEGFRFLPAEETWTRDDGEVFRGEMVAPWQDYDTLDDAQRAWERAELEAALAKIEQMEAEQADMISALALLGVTEEESV